MPVYFEYFFKASFCLAIVFLFYSLLLRRMTYYTWNRYFLVIFSILSFIVPVINVNVFVQAQKVSTNSFIDQIPSIDTYPVIVNSINYTNWFNYQLVLYVYLLVSSVLLVRLLIQLFSIRKIRSKATLVSADEVKIYHLSEPLLPFSFLNSIFINKDKYSENELHEIIDHERVHAEQKHTIDVLISEIIIIFNWYNPFAWLIKKAVRENLEFIADDAVVGKGVDKKNYQYLLLKVTGNIPVSITSSLKFSSLKNRIVMMNKTKTSKFHLLKFFLLVPMIVFVLLAFRNQKEIKPGVAEVKNVSAEAFTLSSLTYAIPDTKIKAIVFKEQNKCFLKPGEPFNLTMVSNEKNRLKNLLERNGYNKFNNNAITFLIDSSSAEKSFSVQVNINVEPSQVAAVKKGFGSVNEIISSDYKHSSNYKSVTKANVTDISESDNQVKKFKINSYLNDHKIISLI